MAQISNATAREFRLMHSAEPKTGTPAQWSRLMDMAYATQNDLVDAFKRHTPRSRIWAKIGDEAKSHIA